MDYISRYGEGCFITAKDLKKMKEEGVDLIFDGYGEYGGEEHKVYFDYTNDKQYFLPTGRETEED